MIIGVDLDDVLGDFSTSFINYHNRLYGTDWKREAMKSYYFHEHTDIEEDVVLSRIFDFYETEDFMRISPVEGARESLERISKDNKLIVMTGRSDAISDKTEKWIDKNYPKIFSEICFTNIFLKENNSSKKSKSFYCHERNVGVIIDDYLEVAEDCAENNIRTLLYTAPWNKDAKTNEMLIRVDSWRDILDKVKVLTN